MKQVRVRFFAAFREAAGVDTEAITTDAATVAELFQELRLRHSGLARLPRSLVAVNEAMVPWESRFEDGSEVLFFPPVGGG